MPVNTAVGWPSASQAGSAYIPEKYAAKIQAVFHETTFLDQIANKEHEQLVKNGGDKIVIRTMPTFAVNDYVIGGTLNYEAPYSVPVYLNIDKAKVWSFLVDDIEKMQSDLSYLPAWVEQAGITSKEAIETGFLADVYTGVDGDNSGATAGRISNSIDLGVAGAPVQVSSSTILTMITNFNLVLDEQKVPKEGRWALLPARICQLLKLSDLKFANQTGDATGVIRTGLIGEVDGMQIFQSNLVSSVLESTNRCYNCLFGHKIGISWASQMSGRPEMLRDKETMGTYVRGMFVYGYGVTKAEAVGTAYLYV